MIAGRGGANRPSAERKRWNLRVWTLVDTKDWEHPAVALWDPKFTTFAAGDEIGYSCTYQNTTAQAITVGESAEKNEMCMVIGYYFPATGNRYCLNSLYFDQ